MATRRSGSPPACSRASPGAARPSTTRPRQGQRNRRRKQSPKPYRANRGRRAGSRQRRGNAVADAVIVATARTPLAKSWRGAFNLTHGATLGGHVVKHAIERAGIEAAMVEDVIMGCANPEGATGFNIARQIALRAGCPVTTAGLTINRFCSSGLQAIASAAHSIAAGEAEVIVAGR